jgi:hypothetical protein
VTLETTVQDTPTLGSAHHNLPLTVPKEYAMEKEPSIKRTPMEVIGESQDNLTAKKPFDPKAIRRRIYAEHYERYFVKPPQMIPMTGKAL